MGYNVKVCEKKVERIQKQILKQKKLIADLNVKIRKFKKELKPRKLRGGGDSESETRNRLTIFDRATHTVYGLNYDVLSNFSILKGIAINNREDLLTIEEISLILKNVKLDIQKTSYIDDSNNFIDIMVFINDSIQKLKKEQKSKETSKPKRKSSDRIHKLLLRVKDALDLFEYYIQHNMNARLKMFNAIFEKIKGKQFSLAPFITYIIEDEGCYIIEDYELGNIIIQAATKHGMYGIIDKMITHKRYFDIVECMKSIVKNDRKNQILKNLSDILKERCLFNDKYESINNQLHKSQQEDFDACIDILLLDEGLKIRNDDFLELKESYAELLIDNLKIVAEEQDTSKFSKIFNKFTFNKKTVIYDYINTLIKFVASNGLLKILKIITNSNEEFLKSENIVKYAAMHGHLNILKWAHTQQDVVLDESTYFFAAENKHNKIIKWLHSERYPWDEHLYNAVAKTGALKIIEKLDYYKRDCKKNCEFGDEMFLNAVVHGHLHILEWIQNKKPYEFIEHDLDICSQAAAAGHLRVLKWLFENEYYIPFNNQNLWKDAALGGHLHILKWLSQDNLVSWDEDNDTGWCTAAAASRGNLEVLNWARVNGFQMNEKTCSAAARGGHLAVLQWARAKGCPWDKRTCEAAAGGGHLEVLQWARTDGCPWDKDTCTAAAEGGHLAVLQWANANGCIANKNDIINKLNLNKFIILRWMLESNINSDDDSTYPNYKSLIYTPFRSGIKKEHLYPYVVKLFIDNKIIIPDAKTLRKNNIIYDITAGEILDNKIYNIDTKLRVKKLIQQKSFIVPPPP